MLSASFWNEKVIGGGYWGGWAFGKYRQAPHYRTGGEELVYFGGLCQDYGECLQLYHHHRAFTGSVIWGESGGKFRGFWGKNREKPRNLRGELHAFSLIWAARSRFGPAAKTKRGQREKYSPIPFQIGVTKSRFVKPRIKISKAGDPLLMDDCSINRNLLFFLLKSLVISGISAY